MTVSQPVLLPIAIILVFIFAIGARPAAAAPDREVQRLPVVDKRDIRMVRLSVGGEIFKKRVLALAQDNYGFIWMGTDVGVYRYDGYTLKRYFHDPSNPSSLSDNTVMAIFKDRSGTIWIGTGYGGVNRFDPSRDAFIHYRHDPDDSRSLTDDHILSIYQDVRGELWIGTLKGLNRLDTATGHFLHYPRPEEKGSNTVWAFHEDRGGNFLVGTGRGIDQLDRASRRFSRFSSRSIVSSTFDNEVVGQFTQDRSGELWVTSGYVNGLGLLDIKSGELKRYVFASEDSAKQPRGVIRMLQDRNGVLWIGTARDGLLALDQKRRRFVRYGNEPDSGISGQVWTLLEDSEGTIWVGSEAGVARIQTDVPFVTYQRRPSDPDSLRSNRVLAVHADAQGFLWIGTDAGLHRLDRRTGQMVVYQNNPRDPRSLSYNAVSAIEEDGSGGLWVGTHGGGLNRFDRTSQRFSTYRHDPNNAQSLSSDIVVSLQSESGVLWVGTEDGLNRFEPETGRFKIYRREIGSISDNIVRSVLRDRTGTLWVGTNTGLNRLDPRTERFTAYLHNESDPYSISHDGITTLHEDRQGTLWIGTRRGLNRLDRTTGRFESFTARDGLISDYIEAMREDSRGNLWLATHDGLSEFRPATKFVHNYSEADGLPGHFQNPTGTERSSVTREGELVFGSDYGVTVFDPNLVSTKSVSPPVLLTDFRLFNETVIPSHHSTLRQPIWATRALTLTHEQNILTLEFAALSYVAPERNRYRYKLEPLESRWNEVGAGRRVATYTNLRPGNYVFRVQGSNEDQLWNETGAQLDITVLPPLWETWWFRSIVFLSIVSLAFAAYRWRVRSLHVTASRLEAQVVQRTRELEVAKEAAEAANVAKSKFLSHMSHELRTPLNVILGFSALLRDRGVSPSQRKDLETINSSGNHLLNLINEVLDVAKIESGRIDVHLDACDLKRLISEVADMIGVRAAEKNLQLHCIQSPGFPTRVRTDAAKLRQVLINLLGNAVKFTERGSVTLRSESVPCEDRRRALLTFCVEDTGVGIATEDQSRIFEAFVQAGKGRSHNGTGLGLSISREFVELMGGTIQLESVRDKGSRFFVALPVELADESALEGSETEDRRTTGVEPNGRDFRVLVVEDNEQNGRLMQQLLEGSGLQVQLAENGARGVELFQGWRPHFIWMDLAMPVMDGWKAMRRIRSLEGGSEVKIAVVTASVAGFREEDVLAAGADDVIKKPYRATDIFDCLARHLGLKRVLDTPQQELGPGPLAKEELRALPKELLQELAAVIVTLDSTLIQEVIARISTCDEAVARKLSALAERYSYTPILELLKDQDDSVAAASVSGASPSGDQKL